MYIYVWSLYTPSFVIHLHLCLVISILQTITCLYAYIYQVYWCTLSLQTIICLHVHLCWGTKSVQNIIFDLNFILLVLVLYISFTEVPFKSFKFLYICVLCTDVYYSLVCIASALLIFIYCTGILNYCEIDQRNIYSYHCKLSIAKR